MMSTSAGTSAGSWVGPASVDDASAELLTARSGRCAALAPVAFRETLLAGLALVAGAVDVDRTGLAAFVGFAAADLAAVAGLAASAAVAVFAVDADFAVDAALGAVADLGPFADAPAVTADFAALAADLVVFVVFVVFGFVFAPFAGSRLAGAVDPSGRAFGVLAVFGSAVRAAGSSAGLLALLAALIDETFLRAGAPLDVGAVAVERPVAVVGTVERRDFADTNFLSSGGRLITPAPRTGPGRTGGLRAGAPPHLRVTV